MTDATSPLFQATADISNLTKNTMASGVELVNDTTQAGTNLMQNVGSFVSEPTQLFQPTKAVSTLGSFTKGVADFGVESVKGGVQDVVETGKNVAMIWSEPNPDGSGIFQPQKPLETLTSIGGKVLQSGGAIAGGIIKAGTNVLKKGIGIFKKKENP